MPARTSSGTGSSTARPGLRARWRAAAQARGDRHCDAIIAAREVGATQERRAELAWRWKAATERPGLQLGHIVSTPGGGIVQGRLPRCVGVGVDKSGSTVLTVELSPGLIVADLEAVGEELASAMMVHRLQFELIGRGPRVLVKLVRDDPHARILRVVESVPDALTLGPDEHGVPIRFPLSALPMWAIQSTTGFGKTTLLYSVLSQLVAMPGVRIAGIDPSGIIWRPLPADRWRVSGLADPQRAVDVLAELVAEMDQRCSRMPLDDDKLPCGPGCRDEWLVVIVEELPGLLVALDAADPKLGKRARALLARLHAEARKTGLRMISVAQRYDSNSTAGAIVRNNCALRSSFAVENRSAVEMLHEGVSPDVVAEHLHAPPGIALVSAPGQPLARVRFPLVSYRDWAAAAAAGAAAVAPTSPRPSLWAVQ